MPAHFKRGFTGDPPPTPYPSDRGSASLGNAALITAEGIIGYAVPELGRFYLATPWPVGSRVLVCAPAGCVELVTTDVGPSLAMQRAGRVADLNSVDWQAISGVALRYGLTVGTLTLVERP